MLVRRALINPPSSFQYNSKMSCKIPLLSRHFICSPSQRFFMEFDSFGTIRVYKKEQDGISTGTSDLS